MDCKKTYYVDSVPEQNICSCGGQVVVGNPSITRIQYDASRSKKDLIETVINSHLESQKRLYSKLQDSGELYEYDVDVLADDETGSITDQAILKILRRRADSGWRLVSAYCNEVGHNSIVGINATMCQHVFIFERNKQKQRL